MAQKRARRRFTREDKAQAVQRLIESGLPLADIAAELDVSPGQLSQWRNEQLAAGSAEGVAPKKADEAEMLRLKREGKRLEEGDLVLRQAAAFFRPPPPRAPPPPPKPRPPGPSPPDPGPGPPRG